MAAQSLGGEFAISCAERINNRFMFSERLTHATPEPQLNTAIGLQAILEAECFTLQKRIRGTTIDFLMKPFVFFVVSGCILSLDRSFAALVRLSQAVDPVIRHARGCKFPTRRL